MTFPERQLNVLVIILLVVQMFLPLLGPVCISGFSNNADLNHAEFAIVHMDYGSDLESKDDHQHISHSCERDELCEIVSGTGCGYSPVIFTFTSSDKGGLLPGYDTPIDFPPEIQS
jgi:hypothetical protein